MSLLYALLVVFVAASAALTIAMVGGLIIHLISKQIPPDDPDMD